MDIRNSQLKVLDGGTIAMFY